MTADTHEFTESDEQCPIYTNGFVRVRTATCEVVTKRLEHREIECLEVFGIRIVCIRRACLCALWRVKDVKRRRASAHGDLDSG